MLNLSCHAGGQWKDDGSKSVRAASVNGVVVWLGNPQGGRGESEKEWMTEGGGNKRSVHSFATRKCFSLHSFVRLTQKYILTYCSLTVESVQGNFFKQNKTKCGQKKNSRNRLHVSWWMQWELDNTSSNTHKALQPAWPRLMLTVYSENDWWPFFSALLHHCYTKT